MAGRLINRLRSLRWRALALWIVAVAAASALATWGAAARTSSSAYCASCHEMDSYHASWKSGGHKDVSCLACHAEPEQAAAEGVTTAGLKQRLSYVLGSFRGRLPQGLVEDANCTACHAKDELGRTAKPFRGIAFDHGPHLQPMGKGLHLRCTSCHTSAEGDSHVSVAEETCFSCHLREPGVPSAIDTADAGATGPVPGGACLTCHGTRLKEDAPLAERHATVLRDGVSCARCHGEMRHGSTGEIAASRCRTCHFSEGVPEDPEAVASLLPVRLRRIRIECQGDCRRCHFREGKFRVEEDSTHLHGVHTVQMKVECAECHGLTRHLPSGAAGDRDNSCESCHGPVAAAQRGYFTEPGASQPSDSGFPHFHARIACGFCHVAPVHGDGPDYVGERPMEPADACRNCHAGAEQGDFGHLASKWGRSNREAIALLREYMAAAEDAVGSSGNVPDAAAASGLLSRANLRLDAFERDGVGFHNLQMARHLLKTVGSDARAAVDRVGAAARVPALKEPTDNVPGDCARCHLSPAENIQLGYRVYSHQHHRDIPGVTCTTCHTEDPHPTSLALTSEQCSSCHHAPEKRQMCATCHDLENSMYRGLWEPGAEKIANPMVEKVHCSQCHFPEEGQLHPILPTKETCRICHEQDVGLLMDDWKENVRSAARRLERAVANAAGVEASLSQEERRSLDRAREALHDVQRDRSHGVHNPTGVQSALTRWAAAIERMVER